MFRVIEGSLSIVDSLGNVVSTISGANGTALQVKEQNVNTDGHIQSTAHNYGQYNGSWSPFSVDDEGRLRVVSETTAAPHTLSGTQHIGILSDEQIPDYITRDAELSTVSGILQSDIDDHVGDVANPHTVTLEQARTAGNIMTGGVVFNPTSNMTVIDVSGSNLDLVWMLGHDTSGYGYYWKYEGTGSGDTNYLYLYSENATGPDFWFYRCHQVLHEMDIGVTLSMQGSNDVRFRDSDIYINSNDDGHLDINADTQVDVNSDLYVSGNFILDTGSTVNIIRDEDDFGHNDSNALVTQQSTKAYVDTVSGSINNNLVVHTSDVSVHRELDDTGTSNIELWSAEKIQSEITTATGTLSSDHGDLTGLGDDDHAQYHNDARGDARYYTETELDAGQLDNRYYTETEADTIHTTLSGGLQSNIDGKSDIGHVHDLRYYTQTVLNSGQLDNRYYTETEINVHTNNLNIHRALNDAGTSNIELWSAEKIQSEITTATGTLSSDHGDLTGLGDDDHAQYHNDARGDARYYTETELDAGQLDNRYYTETEADTIHTTLSGSLQDQIDDRVTYPDLVTTSGVLQDQIDVNADHSNLDNLDYSVAGHTGFMSLNTNQAVSGIKTFDEKIILTSVDSDILPSIDDVYDLGSQTNNWKNLHVETISGNPNDNLYLVTSNNRQIRLYSDRDIINCLGDHAGTNYWQIEDDVDGVQMRVYSDGQIIFGAENPVGSEQFRFVGSVRIEGDLDIGGTTVTGILDEDDLVSDSNQTLATQQSIKAYVDNSTSASGHVHDDRYYTETEVNTISGSLQDGIDSEYYYDSTRSKRLSKTKFFLGWGRNNNNASTEYLRSYNGTPSNNAPDVMFKKGTILSMCMSTRNNETWRVRLENNLTAIPGTDLICAASNQIYVTNLNIDFDAGARLSCYIYQGSSISYPKVRIEVAWRE